MSAIPITFELFTGNRERLKDCLRSNSVVVVNSNDVLPTNADGSLPLVPNSDLFYLTGITQEESILVLAPSADDKQQREILFLSEPTDERETWEGHTLSKEEARRKTGIQNIQWLGSFRKLFHRMMCEGEHVYLNTNEHKRAVIEVETREARFVAETMRRYPLHKYERLAPLLHHLRAIKSDAEVNLLRHACHLTERGFRRVLGMLAPGVTETEVEAEFAHEFIRNRARFAYGPIIASGQNALALHYNANADVCRAGELLLLDVAAAWSNYNSDMTRTVPVSGKFSKRQRRVYDAVLRVMRQSILGLHPGKKLTEWQKEGEQMIEKELVDLRLLAPREIKKQDPLAPALKKYFMHGLGHPLGLDVHDVGITTEPIQAGWVMTVEPGIYIREEGIGVRLENNILVTEAGPVDLMATIPLEADEIESLLSDRRRFRRS